jgi:hypothetical protein
MAGIRLPELHKEMDSMLKVEKVVKDPINPVPIDEAMAGFRHFCSITLEVSHPKKNEPMRLATKVP